MKRCFILLAVFVCLYSGNVRAASFTMEQAVSRALDVNPTIQSKLLVLEQARMNVGVAQSYFWPRVSIVASYNELQNRSEVQTYSSDDLSSKSWSQGWRLTLSLFAGFAHLNSPNNGQLRVPPANLSYVVQEHFTVNALCGLLFYQPHLCRRNPSDFPGIRVKVDQHQLI